MEVPLELAPNGSVFVVFRRPARPGSRAVAAREASSPLPDPIALDGEWSVGFESGRGAPGSVSLPTLTSWTRHSDPGIRFFSGTARYQKTFTVPAGWNADSEDDRVASAFRRKFRDDRVASAFRRKFRASLDLGRLWTIGEVWLNGKPLGVVWTDPFEVDCTEALREGPNELVVEVTNTWHNRLVGDAKLPLDERITRSNIAASGGKPWAQLDLLESGLFGPVRLVARRSTRGLP
jgi:hypothetical protein